MAITSQALAIGITGPFGSGCTTAAKILQDYMRYKHIKLSDLLVTRWREENPRRRMTRSNLQALGNRTRSDAKDPGALAQQAIEKLQHQRPRYEHIVFDGIRNLGEIETMRQRFGHLFYLFAIECPASDRWERLQPIYEAQGKNIDDFTIESERDRDQEDAYGQQVQLCVDQADVLLLNDNNVRLADFRKTLFAHVKLITGKEPRYANAHEILMNLAYSGAHGSKCLKRQVGAVLVDAPPGEMGDVVGQGFNENPLGTKPCVEEPKYGADPGRGLPGSCYRDTVRHHSFVKLGRTRSYCPNPKCGKRLQEPKNQRPPWRCPNCAVDLEEFFWPERAMSLCTAVHAEVAAILAAGARARGTTLYTTTFPCFQCAEKIAHVGIKYVVFTEPYPDIRAAHRLDIAGIKVLRYQGVRSRRFDEIFSRARPYVSEVRRVLAERNGV